jgi:hypothetical protein
LLGGEWYPGKILGSQKIAETLEQLNFSLCIEITLDVFMCSAPDLVPLNGHNERLA